MLAVNVEPDGVPPLLARGVCVPANAPEDAGVEDVDALPVAPGVIVPLVLPVPAPPEPLELDVDAALLVEPAAGVAVVLEPPALPGVVEDEAPELVVAAVVEVLELPPAAPDVEVDAPAPPALVVGVLFAFDPPLHAARASTAMRTNEKINPVFFIFIVELFLK